jgi:hypothetical protein
MNLSQLIAHAGDIADETASVLKGTEYVNDAIAKINMKAKANFPFMDAGNPNGEFVFDETWQRVMLVPFVAGRIKTKDSSQFEYTDFYQEFLDGLENFISDYLIPEQYKSTAGKVFDPVTGEWLTITSDIYTNKPYGWSW